LICLKKASSLDIARDLLIDDKIAIDPALHATLWPSFPHFEDFCYHPSLAGIRLNSAMIHSADLDKELEILKKLKPTVPLYYDIKGRQLRVRETLVFNDHMELKINHPIEADTPTLVMFKAGADRALLERIEGDGTHLIFRGGPSFMVKEGESLHIREGNLKVLGDPILPYEIEKIKKVVDFGMKNFYLSYVEDNEEIDILRNYIGKDAELILKIESQKGMDFIRNKYVKQPNTKLMAARGDLYIELNRPHEILPAMKSIIKRDATAFVGSRLLLSVIKEPVPECDDFSDLAWLYDIGYRNFLLCDELCLKGELLNRAVNVFDAFRKSYCV
jgi:hypothetical protein